MQNQSGWRGLVREVVLGSALIIAVVGFFIAAHVFAI